MGQLDVSFIVFIHRCHDIPLADPFENTQYPPGAKRSRLAHATGGKLLLTGVTVYIPEMDHPKREDIENLVLESDGQVNQHYH